jgi:indole-3-glycerol phosphate synthase
VNRLEEILAVKRREIDALRGHEERLRREALARNDFRSLRRALERRADKEVTLIAEIKKASPSAGVIAHSFDPVAIAKNYARAGADAISVLTDEQFFQGHIDYLRAVRDVVDVPLLRKDFILEPVQVIQSAAAGADAILLIVAALENEQVRTLIELAATLQLEALVEVHTIAELDIAVDSGAEIIGINNRNLATFEVDLSVTEQLSEQVPGDVVLVSESGIRSAEDLARVKQCGVDAVLIGEALMRSQRAAMATLFPRNGG